MPGEEDYVERTIAAEWDEMKEATANLVGLENTAKKVNYPFHEEDFTGDEDTYAEWEEKLYAYAEKALAVWEEYEALIEEQQAQMLEEELAKLTEWVELAETLSDHAVMLADNSEHHGELDWTPLTASDTTLTSGKYYLSSNIEMSTITITEDVTLCLNGQTLTHLGDTGSVVRVKGNVTFTLCDCSGDDSGCITEGKGEQGFPSAKYKGGGGICLEDYAHFIMLGGTIYKNCAGNGGGVYVGKNATLDMSGGHIINNTAEENNAGLGGGIYANGNSHITITNGDISGNISDRQAGGILMASPSELTLKTENETDIISITKNVANSTGGGLAALYNSSTEVAGNVTVFGNEDGQAGLQHELAQDRRLAESHGQVYGDFLLAAPHPHGEDDAQHHGTACGDGQHQPGHQIADRVQRADGGLVHGVVDGNVIVLGFDALKILHLF